MKAQYYLEINEIAQIVAEYVARRQGVPIPYSYDVQFKHVGDRLEAYVTIEPKQPLANPDQ